MQRGYLKLWRKVEDSGLLHLHETYALFTFLLIKATHKPRKVGTPHGVVELERGQYISGRLELAAALSLTERGVRTSLDRLVKMDILTIRTTNRYSIYTIVKYNEYQGDDCETTSQTPTNDQLTTSQRPANDQQPTTKQELKTHNTEELKPKPSAAFALPDWIDKADWDLWLKTRKGKKMIPAQMQAQVNKLDKWRKTGIDYRQALKDAGAAGWSGLFEPKKAGGSNRVQEARLDVIDQIMGGLHHEHKRQIKDINPRSAIEGYGEDVSKINRLLREPDAS